MSASDLPRRMRDAAKVINDVNKRAGHSTVISWDSYALLMLAERWEAEDRAATKKNDLVEELAQDMYELSGTCAKWPESDFRGYYRAKALPLIERGWRKGDPS